MGESSGSWGLLAETDSELASVWDECSRLPDAGQNDVLDSFCIRKHIDIPSLIRVGARLQDYRVLAFAGPGYIKYRNMEDGRRWTELGSTYNQLRMVPSQKGDSSTVIVAEGETDAARLTMLYPEAVIAILPAGARRLTQSMVEQVEGYERVLATYDPNDPDKAGDAGWAKFKQHVPHAVRWNPPAGKDWCEYTGDIVPLPAPPKPMPLLVSARDLLTLEYPETASYFEHELLPIGGQLVLHGWSKNFKSFLALDMLAALAQGEEWCCFENIEEPVKVAIVQFEIPPKYYQDRIKAIRQGARQQDLMLDNFMTWTPKQRPQIRVGNKQQEDKLRGELVKAGVEVVLFDPLRRMMGPGVSLNDEDSARYALSFFESLQNEGIAVVFNHHDNKSGARGDADETSMTGSGAWSGDADVIVGVTRVKGERRESGKRNINFLVRNGPPIYPRGMEMQDSGRILYTPEPFGVGEESDGEEAPDI